MAAVKYCCCDSAEDERNMIKILNEENEYSANNFTDLNVPWNSKEHILQTDMEIYF